jgi:hypothetical protein
VTISAPAIDPTVPTNFADATSFLYTGPDPVQTGVEPGTIAVARVAVLRGRVLTTGGAPLSGVRVTVPAHPELGQTHTRADGYYDLAVNGGGTRSISPPWDISRSSAKRTPLGGTSPSSPTP